ncbi:MAG: alpha/beta hydrolase, partial [Bacteroidetes bacterium]
MSATRAFKAHCSGVILWRLFQSKRKTPPKVRTKYRRKLRNRLEVFLFMSNNFVGEKVRQGKKNSHWISPLFSPTRRVRRKKCRNCGMNLILIFLSVLLAYVWAFWLVPKGNPLQEILQIPVWWARMMRLPTSDMARTKIKYGTHWRQYLVVCTPKNGAPGRRGVIVYIHGGGWQFSRPEVFGPNAAEWVRAGFVVVMPSHRRIPFYHCDHMREDLKLILEKTVEWMEAHEMGASRLILGGMSSGGNLAALAALDARGCRPPGFPAD